MSITSTLSRMSMAEKLSIPQLQQAIQGGTIPAYIGIPLLQDKMQMEQRMRAAAQPQQGGEPPPIAEQVLAQARQYGGIDALPSNLPVQTMAGGGIVGFAEGGLTERERRAREIQAQNERTGSWLDKLLPKFEVDPSDTQPVPDNLGAVGAMGRNIDPNAGVMDPRMGPPMQVDMAGTTPPTATPNVPGTGVTDGVVPPARVAPPTPAQKPVSGPPRAAQPAAPETSSAPAAQATPSAMQQYIDMLMKDREGTAGERDKAKHMALLQAGLAMMAGTSPNAFANIGAGASVGLEAYNNAMSDLNKRDRDTLEKALAAQAMVEDMGLKREMFDSDKMFKKTQLDLKRQEIGVMAARVAASGARGGITEKDYTKMVLDQYKALTDGAINLSVNEQAAALQRAREQVDQILGTSTPTDKGKPPPGSTGNMYKYPSQ